MILSYEMINHQVEKIGQIDNRGSHFYLAMYWAKPYPQIKMRN
jgi:monomeric isocitrate dehydrogenase